MSLEREEPSMKSSAVVDVAHADIITTLKEFIRRDTFVSLGFKFIFVPLQFAAHRIYLVHGNKRKNKPIIILTDHYGLGNPWAVFLRFMERKELLEKYDVYWMADSIESFFKIRKQNLPVIYKHGILGIKVFQNADVWVLAHYGKWNLPTPLHNRYESITKIHLGHGVGPKATKGESREYDIYDAICLSSEFIKNRHITLWNAPPNKLYPTGFARLDILLKYLQTPRDDLLKRLGLPENYRKIVLYAPTYDLGIWPWGDQYRGIDKLAKFLDKRNTLLLLRPHPYAVYNRKKLRKLVDKHDNVVFAPSTKFPDIGALIAISDALITDWSSTYTDFLVTRRPILFIDIQRDYFLKVRGKPEVPPELRPGVKVSAEAELYPALEKVLMEGYIPDREFYEKCLHLIHGEPDGHYSDRVIEVIEKVLAGLIKK
ncbi:MAG: hypothetical protein GXO25_06050 [Euryarchaeota archaeon]|nr:hypothetical protein [Euryarchaeota archaeon]